jgi:SH3-like domain-containing protein
MRRGLQKLIFTAIFSTSLAFVGYAGQQGASEAPAKTETATPPPSGLPLPRFVSLKSDKINLRAGPGTEYPISWVYRRAGLPVEVIKEFEGWRQVRDAEGVTGWVLQTFLSRRRTSLVAPWDLKPDAPPPQIPIRSDDSERAREVAILEAGVIADVHACDGVWCEVSVDAYRGFIEQKKLWGVYEGEVLR